MLWPDLLLLLLSLCLFPSRKHLPRRPLHSPSEHVPWLFPIFPRITPTRTGCCAHMRLGRQLGPRSVDAYKTRSGIDGSRTGKRREYLDTEPGSGSPAGDSQDYLNVFVHVAVAESAHGSAIAWKVGFYWRFDMKISS